MNELDSKNVYENYTNAINGMMVEGAQIGKVDLVIRAIDYGANPKFNNSDALQWAARGGHYKTVKYLVDHGADPTADNNNALRWAEHNNHRTTKYYLQEVLGLREPSELLN